MFPPNATSLGDLEEPPPPNAVIWVRPEDMAESPALFKEGIEPGDVCQGGLGDCWFLGALSVVAARMDLMKVILATDEHKEKGIYAFRFYKFGAWREIVIDDLVPVFQFRPVFASSANPDEMWVILIEKVRTRSFFLFFFFFRFPCLDSVTLPQPPTPNPYP